MNEKLERALAVLEAMGRRYIRDFLIEEGWEPQRLRSNWYYSFNFLLSKLYMQGRNDSLSDRYLKKMQECLDSYFWPDYTAKIEALIKGHHIPLDADWNNFELENLHS